MRSSKKGSGVLLRLIVLSFPLVLSARAEATDPEAFVAAFGDVCIPQRLSYKGTVTLAESLGWRPLVPGENDAYDNLVARSDALLAEEMATDPDLLDGSGHAWMTLDIDGRSHLLAVSYLLSRYYDGLGCYLYDFNATAPIDPGPVTRLLRHPVAYTTSGGDPDYAVDPAMFVATVWGPSPLLPRTGDTYLTFIPEGSETVSQTGFNGLVLKFSTSLPNREEFQQ